MIKDEYKNIPEDEFVPLKEGVDSAFWGKYEINKLGQFIIKDTGRIITPVVNQNLVDYPRIILRSKSIKGKIYFIHRLLAITFLKNDDPLNKTEVDHINNDPFDYSLTNLRWVSSSDNKKNRRSLKKETGNYYLVVLDNKIQGVSLEKDKNTKKVSKDTYDFYKSKTDLNEEVWRKHPTLDIQVSSFGCIKHRCGEYTVGMLNKFRYRVVNIGGKLKRVHTLVAETFLANRNLISGEVVDHISTDRLDNSVSNLKVCSQKENMSNPKTKEKFSKRVIQMDLSGNFINEYSTICEAYTSLGVNPKTSSHISDCCRGKMKTYKGYTWKYKD